MSDEINDPIAALRSELASVSVSPDFAARVRERLADDLEPLRAELADLSPSPEFAVRVRQSIEQAGNAGFSWSRLNWRWIVPVSGLAAAAVIAAVVFRPADLPAPAATTAKVIPPPFVGAATSCDPARRQCGRARCRQWRAQTRRRPRARCARRAIRCSK